MFVSDFMRWTERLKWLWDTNGRMRVQNMVGPRRVEDAQPNSVINTFIGKLGTVVSMLLYK